jgi:hypothetical protein
LKEIAGKLGFNWSGLNPSGAQTIIWRKEWERSQDIKSRQNLVSTVKGMEEYLTLLTICQTCKYMGVDFLDFLRSGEKEIHAFAESRGQRRRRTSPDRPATIKSTAASLSGPAPAGG